LESGFAARAAALDGDFKARRERFEVEMRSRAAAVSIEAASKIDFERKNWSAERSRFENQLAETSGNFRNARKEIEDLNSALRSAAESGSARETRFNRELMEAKSNYDRELAFRVNDAVSVQTAHLLEALEAAKAKNDELAQTVAERENSVRALMSEAAEIRRECEERLSLAESEALAARRAELEKSYAGKQARMEENMAALKRGIEADYQARRQELAEGAGLRDKRLAAENLALKEDMAKLRAAQEEATQRAVRRNAGRGQSRPA
jgi:phage host-nuclease inhibitor protein Gam